MALLQWQQNLEEERRGREGSNHKEEDKDIPEGLRRWRQSRAVGQEENIRTMEEGNNVVEVGSKVLLLRREEGNGSFAGLLGMDPDLLLGVLYARDGFQGVSRREHAQEPVEKKEQQRCHRT